MSQSLILPSSAELDAELCRRKLSVFAREGFPVVEPGTPFRPNWHIDAICEHLEACSRREIRNLIINIPPRHMKPVSVDALVLMGDGTRRRLGDIKVGDQVITHHGWPEVVSAIHEQGILDVLKITTSSGRTTVTAPDHPFLTPTGWTQAQDLSPGDTLATVAKPNTLSDKMPHHPAAFALAGYITGDGCVTTTHTSCQANITCLDPVQGQDIMDVCGALGFIARWSKNQKRLNLSGGVRDWLREKGLAGTNSHTKRVPEFVFWGSNPQVARFLGAYFACDGTLNQRHHKRKDLAVTFNSVSHDLLADVQHLLLRIGVRSRLRPHTGGGYKGPNYRSWRLTITSQDDTAKFIARVPVVGAKAARLAAWGIKRTSFDGTLLPDTIETIEPAGSAECRCLTVEGAHSFTADDLVVHNSLLAAVLWPCWEWLNFPERKFMFVSYGADLSQRDSNKCRTLIKSKGLNYDDGRDYTLLQRVGYQGLLQLLGVPDVKWAIDPYDWEISAEQDAKKRFANTRGGYRIATSVGGIGTGEGGDYVVIDDPHKADDAESEVKRIAALNWHDSTIPSRFNDPTAGVEVVIMQRLHEEDLTGHLLETGYWTHLCLPAEYEPKHPFRWPDDPRKKDGELLWPAHMPQPEIDKAKKSLRYRYAGQYQQRPAPQEGILFKRRNYRRWRYEEIDGVRHFVLMDGPDEYRHVGEHTVARFQVGDIAASDKTTADYTVVGTFGATPAKDLLVLDIKRQRFDALEVHTFLESCNDEKGRPPIFIEEFGAGKSPLKRLRRDDYPAMALKREVGTNLDKIARAWNAIAVYEDHKSFHPVSGDPWVPELENELCDFPNGRNDDQVDVVSYAARLLPTMAVEQRVRQPRSKTLTGGSIGKTF